MLRSMFIYYENTIIYRCMHQTSNYVLYLLKCPKIYFTMSLALELLSKLYYYLHKS